MTARILLIAAAVAWVATLAGLVWMVDAAGMRSFEVFLVLLHGDFIIVACAVLSGLMGAVGIVGAITGDRAKLLIGAGDAFVLGLVGAVTATISMRMGLICINPPIPFAYDAIFYAQALLVLLIGLTGAVLSLTALTLRRRPAA